MKCLNIHLIHCQVCDQPPTAEVTKTSSAEASGCGEMKRVRRNVKNLTKEERERLVGAMQALIDRGRYQELGNIHGAPGTICPEGEGGFCCSHDLLLLPWQLLFIQSTKWLKTSQELRNCPI